jgi:hypothetical protein
MENLNTTLQAPGLPDGLMDPRTTAAFLIVTVPTLADWRCKGIGPDFVKCGALVRYRLADLQAWLAAHTKKGA